LLRESHQTYGLWWWERDPYEKKPNIIMSKLYCSALIWNNYVKNVLLLLLLLLLLFHPLSYPSFAHTIKMCSSTFPYNVVTLTQFRWADSTWNWMIVYTLHRTLFAPNSTEQMYNEVPVKCSAVQGLPTERRWTNQTRGENYYMHYKL